VRPPVEASVAVVFDEAEHVLLVRWDYGHRCWGPPGGAIETGETPEEAAVRETLEETGLTVSSFGLIGRYEFGSPTRLVGFAYLCRAEDGEPSPAEGEIAELGWFPARSLPEPSENIGPVAIADALKGLRGVERKGLPWHPVH
jgi:8-oxo-dGTP diphosphatase